MIIPEVRLFPYHHIWISCSQKQFSLLGLYWPWQSSVSEKRHHQYQQSQGLGRQSHFSEISSSIVLSAFNFKNFQPCEVYLQQRCYKHSIQGPTCNSSFWQTLCLQSNQQCCLWVPGMQFIHSRQQSKQAPGNAQPLEQGSYSMDRHHGKNSMTYNISWAELLWIGHFWGC